MTDFDLSKLYSTKATTSKRINGFDNSGNPIEFDVEVKRLAHSEIAAFLIERSSSEKKTQVEAVPRVLARAIRFDGGTVSAKPDDFMKMDVTTVNGMLEAFLEVNKIDQDQKLGNA